MGNGDSSWRSLWAKNRWLSLGLGVKRWLLMLGLGAGLTGMGMVYLILILYRAEIMPIRVYNVLTLQFWPIWLRVLVPLTLGAVVIFLAVIRIGTNLIAPFRQPGSQVVETLYDYSKQGRGPHIVAIGGGTGLPNLLRGLTGHTRNITAIITVADDGGSSGRLRRELGLLPPGDFRNNLAALSRDEALMTQVLQYRFGGSVTDGEQGELQGHAFGNLLLAALTGITGSFDEALLAAQRVLAVRGRVLPSTLDDVNLVADIENGGDGEPMAIRLVEGESAITQARGRINRIRLAPENVRAYPAALHAILQADLILIGPGSLYTSILPNLLVPDLAEALRHAMAPKVYICNLATQPGETDNYSVAEHVATILQHVPADCVDMVLANDNLSVDPDTGGGKTIFVKVAPPADVKMITADLVDEDRPWRHDVEKLASTVVSLLPKLRKT